MWRTVFEYAFDPEGMRGKTLIGSRQAPRRCKFCGLSTPEVTFKKEAHIIPAAFGNRTLFSLEECDDCNEFVGAPLENDLANLLGLERAMGRMRYVGEE